jgi:hypothetical protein
VGDPLGDDPDDASQKKYPDIEPGGIFNQVLAGDSGDEFDHKAPFQSVADAAAGAGQMIRRLAVRSCLSATREVEAGQPLNPALMGRFSRKAEIRQIERTRVFDCNWTFS